MWSMVLPFFICHADLLFHSFRVMHDILFLKSLKISMVLSCPSTSIYLICTTLFSNFSSCYLGTLLILLFIVTLPYISRFSQVRSQIMVQTRECIHVWIHFFNASMYGYIFFLLFRKCHEEFKTRKKCSTFWDESTGIMQWLMVFSLLFLWHIDEGRRVLMRLT